jgi:hypothetical protein
VAQAVEHLLISTSPEFKPQYCPKKRKEKFFPATQETEARDPLSLRV